MANNFPKNFQETVIFHLRQWRQPVEKRDLKKREGEKTRRGRGEKEREKKKQEGKNEQKISPLLTYRIILPISPQRAATSTVQTNEATKRVALCSQRATIAEVPPLKIVSPFSLVARRAEELPVFTSNPPPHCRTVHFEIRNSRSSPSPFRLSLLLLSISTILSPCPPPSLAEDRTAPILQRSLSIYLQSIYALSLFLSIVAIAEKAD